MEKLKTNKRFQLGLKKERKTQLYRGKVTAGRTNEKQLHVLLATTEDKNYRQIDELTTTAHPQHEHWQQPAFKKRLALLLWNHHFDSYLKLGEGRKVAMKQICISQHQTSTLNKVLGEGWVQIKPLPIAAVSTCISWYRGQQAFTLDYSSSFHHSSWTKASSIYLLQRNSPVFSPDGDCYKLKVRYLYMKKSSELCWLYTLRLHVAFTLHKASCMFVQCFSW